jgi:hypothetical protein
MLESPGMAKRSPSKAVRDYLRDLGRRGGEAAAGAGAKVRFAKMTAEERRALAKKAARARWAKKKA